VSVVAAEGLNFANRKLIIELNAWYRVPAIYPDFDSPPMADCCNSRLISLRTNCLLRAL
jgi:hypothetical protein